MPSIAPLVAAIQRRLANLPGPVRGSGEASNGEPVQVELLVAGVWVDITSYVLVRDDSGRISVTAGIRDEGSQTQAAQSSLELANPDGRFSPKNPLGEYFDILSWRNAQIRISVPDGNGGKAYLIWGEGSEWAPNWDSTGSDVWTDVAVNGIIQRLAQAPAPEKSIIYRAITDPFLTGLVAYWPCEDPTGSTALASPLVGSSPMRWTGTPELASYEGFGASDPLPTLTGASLTGGVADYDTTSVTQYQMRFLLAVPKAGFGDVDVIARMQVSEVAAGASLLNYFDIHYNDPPGGVGSYGGPGTLTIQTFDGDESPIGSTNSTTMDVRGRLLRVSLENSISGTTMTSTLRVLDINSGVEDSAAITIVSTSLSRVIAMSLAPDTLSGSAGLASGAAGHLLLQNTITDIDDLGRAIQPTGEAAGRRMQRLCAEEAVAFEWIGDLDDTVLMGPQGKANLLSLVQECVQADGGFLYESTDQLGLGYRTRASLYGQDPALVLSYTGFNLADIPVPVTDDRYIQNQVVVTVNGVSQTYTETSGALGTDTIGVYGETSGVTLNLAASDAATLRDQAAWRVRIGTTDDERYPTVSVNLAHPSMTPELKRAILGLRMGDRMQLTGMPSWLAPDTVDQLIIGTSRRLNRFLHEITFTCIPAAPYNQVGVTDADDARVDTDGSELLTAVTTSDTAFTVVPSAGQSTLWTTDSTDFPFDARLGGEVVTATAGTGAVEDTFARTESSGWGTADTGQAWTVTGGNASDYSVGSGYGVALQPVTNTAHLTLAAAPSADVDVYVDVASSTLASGASLVTGPLVRAADASNWYVARVEFTTSATIQISLRKRVAGSETTLSSVVTTSLTHVAGTFYRVRLQAMGTALKARIWLTTNLEPDSWDVTATDGSLTTADNVGTRSFAASGSTAVNPELWFDNFRVVNPQTLTVTRSVNGVVKSHAAGTEIALAYPTYLAL